ncbi:hypothetical protein [Sphingomonas sp.]|uniref:hypothetical protein n=1 Tax=Sphingomonas sp. TaxID=28214 RepID=UPI00286E1948|nr:hypothetical protein [Sphingomonas sp.]
MKHELIERTVRDWVMGDPARGARALEQRSASPFHAGQSAEQIADALILLAGRMEFAENRLW